MEMKAKHTSAQKVYNYDNAKYTPNVDSRLYFCLKLHTHQMNDKLPVGWARDRQTEIHNHGLTLL